MERENCYGCDWNDTVSQYVNNFGLLSYQDPFIDSVIENACGPCRPEIPEFYKNRCKILMRIEGLSKGRDPDTVIDFVEEYLDNRGFDEGLKNYFLNLLEINLDQQ